MSRIYLIPGLGADERIFKNILLPGHEVTNVNWIITPEPEDTLSTYAQKLVDCYQIKPGAVLIGNSLGGMVSMEIANLMAIKQVVLISSIKTIDEAPWYFKVFRNLPVYQIIPGKLLTGMGFLAEPVFGKMSKEDAWLFNDMMKQTSPIFMKWAMYAVLHWYNKTIPTKVYHIAGDKDLVFPKNIPGATVIKGGTHIMIFNQADEINQLLATHIL